jgi:hypothetical protein
MLPFRQASFLATVLVIGASAWSSASVTPKWSVAELTGFADVIVTGRVERVASGWDPAVDTIYTYVTVDVDDVLKGPVGRGRLVIKQLGGAADAMNLTVFDQATFIVGEQVLLYLEARPRDGSLYTSALWQGKWRIEEQRGERMAARFEPPGHRSASPVDRQSLAAARVKSAAIGGGSTAHVEVAPIDEPSRAVRSYALLGPYRYLFSPIVEVQAGGQLGLPGGGVAEIQAAIAKWNAAGSSFRYTLGSASGPPRCASQQLGNSRVTISFSDPCGEISNSGGTLAIGGSYFFPSGGGTVNGQVFGRAFEGFVINNDSPAALNLLRQAGCFGDVQLHELGHVLGLDHSADRAAIMFPSIDSSCSGGAHNLSPDDIAGVQFIYPPGSVILPSLSPTGLQVGVNGTTSITVTFNPIEGTDAASGGVTYRLDFRQASGGPIVTSIMTKSIINILPLAPGTLGTYLVTVTAIVAAGAGPPSAPAVFTIGAGPVEFTSGDGGPCAGPPSAPVVTGGVAGGTATATWPGVAGATGYLLSAGTSIGATNLYPLTFIGTNNVATATGLPAGFAAWVRVIAVNACGHSVPTDYFIH